MRHVVLIIAAAFLAPAQTEPPAIFQNGVFNSASRFPPALPGGIIAHGARFTVQGVRLGARGQTTVEVRTAAQLHTARLLSVSADSIEAILPPAVPAGNANIVVIANGKASAPFAIRVQDSAPGLYSANRLGWGPVSRPGSAAPGAPIVLAATGLGRSAPELIVGGRPVRAVARAKAGEPGLDELAFTLPRDVPEGCHVPIYARTGTKTGELVSNIVSIRVSRRPESCADSLWPAVPATNAVILLFQMAVTLEGIPGNPQSSIEEQATALFSTPGSSLPPIRVLPPVGTCIGVAGSYQSGEARGLLFGLNLNLPGARQLDAGSQIEIGGNGDTRKLTARSLGLFSQSLALRRAPRADPPPFLFPGDYTVSGKGGADGGAFRTHLRVRTPLVWIDRERLTEVDRKRGTTLTWAGQDPHQPVVVVGFSVDQVSTAAYSIFCLAAPGAAQFTIPAQILANLPATEQSLGLPLSYMAVLQSPSGSWGEIRTTGLAGFAIYFGGAARSVVYR